MTCVYTQIGNLSILLQEGTANDQFDFLDLHIQGWVAEAARVNQKCFSGPKARRLSAELESALEAVDYFAGAAADANNVTTTAAARRRSLPSFPQHDPRYYKDTSTPKSVFTKYYDRTWHPYDWYLKANTEVLPPTVFAVAVAVAVALAVVSSKTSQTTHHHYGDCLHHQ
jgi:hypothetical protein